MKKLWHLLKTHFLISECCEWHDIVREVIAVLNCRHAVVLCLCTGLQASPSKHTSYSVRMENAVPIVTQAPGAQPLQIQPGLLTQVGRLPDISWTNRVSLSLTDNRARTAHIQTMPSASLFTKNSIYRWRLETTQCSWPFLCWQVFFPQCVQAKLSCALLPPSHSLSCLSSCFLPLFPSPGGWGCHGLMHTKAEAIHTEKVFTGACTVQPKYLQLAYSCWN